MHYTPAQCQQRNSPDCQGAKESNGGEAVDPFLHALVMVFAFTPVFTVALLLLPFHGILPALSQQKGQKHAKTHCVFSADSNKPLNG